MASSDNSGSGRATPVIARTEPLVTPVSNANLVAQPGIVVGPVIPLPVDFVGNLFEPGRPGAAVVRPDDLLALRVERQNLNIVPGSPPRLVKAGTGAARLILHFPPQAITEETFFETRPAGTNDPPKQNPNEPPPSDPGGSEPLRPPPVNARVSGESRLAFNVPDGFDVPYTLAGVLDACRTLALNVAANAQASAPGRLVIRGSDLFQASQVRALPARQRAALASFAVRSLRIAAVQGDMATVSLRQSSAGGGLRAVAVERTPDLVIVRDPPKPALPTAAMTSIELPWRLILSPHGAERWRHATAPVTSAATGHTELWHSRLVAPDKDGHAIEPPHPDANRTVRAIWALTGEGSPKAMQGQWPNPADLPPPSTSPFRMPLDDFDRFQISHLSSNFSVSGYTPQSVGTDLMMLSALGGWLDSRGGWNPPGLSVEEWVHRATMARDHYVRVVYRGFLFPFGHRVSLVKVSERKFHNGAKDGNGQPVIEQVAGNTAYLRQRLFMIVRERERTFDDPAYAQLRNIAGSVFFQRELPFSTIRILTQVTPNLDRPDIAPSSVAGNGQRMFWPHVGGQPFKFQCVATDLDGRRVAFDLPMIFMDNTMACPRTYNATTKKLEPAWATAESSAIVARDAFAAGGAKRTADLKLQRVALATSLKPGDTSVQIETMTFGGEAEPKQRDPAHRERRAEPAGVLPQGGRDDGPHRRARPSDRQRQVEPPDLERALPQERLRRQQGRGVRRRRQRKRHGDARLLRPGRPFGRLCAAQPEAQCAQPLRRAGDGRCRPVHQRHGAGGRRFPDLDQRPAAAAAVRLHPARRADQGGHRPDRHAGQDPEVRQRGDQQGRELRQRAGPPLRLRQRPGVEAGQHRRCRPRGFQGDARRPAAAGCGLCRGADGAGAGRSDPAHHRAERRREQGRGPDRHRGRQRIRPAAARPAAGVDHGRPHPGRRPRHRGQRQCRRRVPAVGPAPVHPGLRQAARWLPRRPADHPDPDRRGQGAVRCAGCHRRPARPDRHAVLRSGHAQDPRRGGRCRDRSAQDDAGRYPPAGRRAAQDGHRRNDRRRGDPGRHRRPAQADRNADRRGAHHSLRLESRDRQLVVPRRQSLGGSDLPRQRQARLPGRGRGQGQEERLVGAQDQRGLRAEAVRPGPDRTGEFPRAQFPEDRVQRRQRGEDGRRRPA